MLRLLLISNSTVHGGGYLDHCSEAIQQRLDGVDRVLFVPFALQDRDAYATAAREAFGKLGKSLDSLHQAADPRQAVAEASAIFVGGGNTFRLLDHLYRLEVREAIAARARDGMPYIGSSAGSNVAAPTIRTTNDMPIVQPPSFEALGLIPFNLNPHYLDPDPTSTHMGETREERLLQFHEENKVPVLGLREGSWLWVDGGKARLGGTTGARLFRRGREREEFLPGAELDFLMEG